MEDKELEQLNRDIDERKNELSNVFDKKTQEIVKKQEGIDNNKQLVNQVFNQAVVEQVKNNEELQKKVLDTAEKYTKTQMNIIASNVEREDKKANVDNNKDACECYGFDEPTTAKKLVSLMKIGYYAMSVLYIIVATFTVMPIIFLAKKVVVAVKKLWIAIILAILIYGGTVLTPIIMALIK